MNEKLFQKTKIDPDRILRNALISQTLFDDKVIILQNEYSNKLNQAENIVKKANAIDQDLTDKADRR